MTKGEGHIKKGGRYLRLRVEEPELFVEESMKTQDIGRKGHSKRVAGIRKDTGKWDTQAFLFSLDDIRINDKGELMFIDKKTQETFEKVVGMLGEEPDRFSVVQEMDGARNLRVRIPREAGYI